MRKIFLFSVFLSFLLPDNIKKSEDYLHKGIDALYNFNFKFSIALLDSAYSINPTHPLIPFVTIAAKWQYIQTTVGYDSSYTTLNQEIDNTIPIYKKLIKQYPDSAEFVLYLGSTYGLRARVALAKKEWFKVITSGYKGYRLVKKAQDMKPLLKDTYMPLGLMEYFASRSSIPVQLTADLVGIHSNKKDGLEKLQIAAMESEYSWIESSNALTYAYLHLEKDYIEALKWVCPLVDHFPDNPFFLLLKAEGLAKLKKWDEVFLLKPKMKHFSEIGPFLQKNEAQLKMTYIEALFEFDKQKYKETINKTSWMIENYFMEFDWLLGFAHLLRGKSYEKTGKFDKAYSDYKIVTRLDNNYPEIKEAKILLEKLNK